MTTWKFQQISAALSSVWPFVRIYHRRYNTSVPNPGFKSSPPRLKQLVEGHDSPPTNERPVWPCVDQSEQGPSYDLQWRQSVRPEGLQLQAKVPWKSSLKLQSRVSVGKWGWWTESGREAWWRGRPGAWSLWRSRWVTLTVFCYLVFVRTNVCATCDQLHSKKLTIWTSDLLIWMIWIKTVVTDSNN